MQFASDTALDEAIKSPNRTIRARVTVDWNGDGEITDALEVLDEWLDSVSTDRSLKGSAPEELLLVEGSSAAELELNLGGEYDGMNLVAVFSRYNRLSPLFGKRTVGAEIRYSLIVTTAMGEVEIPQFIGDVRTITPDRKNNSVQITALDRVEQLRKPIVMSKWAMHEQSIRWGEIDSQVCWSHSVIDNALRQCDVGPGPKRPTTRVEMGVPDGSYDGVQFFLAGNGSYVPTIGWMDNPNFSSFPNRGKAMYEGNAQVHPAVVDDPDAQPLLGLNGVGSSNYGGGWPAAYDREGYLRFWCANRDEMPWRGSMYMGLTLNNASDARNFSLGNGVEILQMVGGASRIYRIMINNGQIWATRRIFRGVTGPNDEFDDGTTAKVNIPNINGPVDVFVQWDNTLESGSKCHVQVGSNTNGFPNVGSPVQWEYYQNAMNIMGRVSVGNVVDMSDIFVCSRNVYGSPQGAKWHAWREPKYAAVLDRGLNRLSHIPIKRPIEAWKVITDVAAAEFGAVFWDENGIFRFWNQEHVQDKQNAIVRRVTLDDLDQLNMTDTLDSVRNVIAIEAKRARALDVPSIFSSNDVGQFETPANSTRRFTVWSDNVLAPFATRGGRYQGTQGTVAGLPIFGEGSHGYVLQGYFTGGTYGTGWYEWNAGVGAVYPYVYFNRDGSLTVNVQNTNNIPIRFAKGLWDNPTDDSPAFNSRGTALLEDPPQTFIVRNPQSIERYGEKTLELSGDWYHDTFSANNMISTLMRRTAAPIPVTDDITIPGDPRLQLGDTVAIDDYEGYGVDILAQLIGIKRRWSLSEGLRDTLTTEVTQSSDGDKLPDVPPGVTIERVNLCKNPRLMNNVNDWFGGNRITAIGFPGANNAYQATNEVILPRAEVTGGHTYTMSVYCIPGFTGYMTVSVDWYEFAQDGATSGQFWGSAGEKRVFVTNGELTRLSMSVTAPMLVDQAPLIVRYSGSAQFSQVLYEEGPQLFDYFDGSTFPPNTWWYNDVTGNEISYWLVQGDEDDDNTTDPGDGGEDDEYNLRKNLCVNPAAGTNTDNWFAPDGLTMTRVTGLVGERPTGLQFVGTNLADGVAMPNYEDPIVGQDIICSVELQNDGDDMLSGILQFHFKDEEGAWVGSGGDTEFFIAPGMRARVSTLAVPVPVGTGNFNGYLYGSTEPFTATAGMYEESSFNDFYFDGDSENTSDTKYSWESTPHNSVSIAETGDAPGSGDAPANTSGSAALAEGWGAPSHWDTFNYIGPPDPNKWSVYGNGGSEPHPTQGPDSKQCWPGHANNGRRCIEQVQLDGEKLSIAILPNGDQGAVSHKFDQQFGKWEVRARIRPETNSFGFPGHAVLIIWPQSNVWPQDGEYDFFECDISQAGTNAANTTLSSYIHYPHPDSVAVQQEYAEYVDPVDLTEYHNYAIEWTPDGIYGYFDGALWFSHEGGAIPGTRSNIQDMASGHLTMQVDNFNEAETGMQQGYMDVLWAKAYPLVPVDPEEESPGESPGEPEEPEEPPTETRRNLCPNPSLKTSNAEWYGPGGAARFTGSTGLPRSTCWRAVPGGDSLGPQGEITAGLPHTYSAWVKTDYTGSLTVFHDRYVDGAWATGASTSASVTAGVPTRVSITFTPTGSQNSALLGIIPQGGTYTEITAALYEQTDTLKDYFDGDSTYASWDSGNDGTSTLSPPSSGPGVNPAPNGWLFFIDTSHFQEGIDLQEVYDRGYAGNIVKIGQGASSGQGFGQTLDDEFETLVSESLGLWPDTTAGYWYVGDTESAASQASRCAGALGSEYENLPVMLDWELGGGNWSNLLSVLSAFRDEGINVTLLYCGQTYANANGVSSMSSTGLSFIHSRFWYNPNTDPDDAPRIQWDDIVANASGGSSWGFATVGGKTANAHQFTANGSVYDGMAIDVSAFQGTMPQLIDMFQGN